MLTVITGPMYSGKSSALISRAISHAIADDFVIAFKPAIDKRYDEINISTHDNRTFPSYPVNLDCFMRCNEVVDNLTIQGKRPNVILFDEVQFFNKEDILSLIEEFMTFSHVIVAGLKEDANGKPFGAMPEILCMADDIICLKAVCSKCKKINSATRTHAKKKINGQILVGGIDIYEPRCLECWL